MKKALIALAAVVVIVAAWRFGVPKPATAPDPTTAGVTTRARSALLITLDTVRSHIRSIYGKMGVTSREALFFKLRPYRL